MVLLPLFVGGSVFLCSPDDFDSFSLSLSVCVSHSFPVNDDDQVEGKLFLDAFEGFPFKCLSICFGRRRRWERRGRRRKKEEEEDVIPE